jgi:hypothetical protein
MPSTNTRTKPKQGQARARISGALLTNGAAEPRGSSKKFAKRRASATAEVIDSRLEKPGRLRSAAGTETDIPAINGDGADEIRDMRGEILRANIAKALEGSHLHMKALFEYAGLWPAGGATGEKSDDSSLAALLLDKLEVTSHAREEPQRADSEPIAALRANNGGQG